MIAALIVGTLVAAGVFLLLRPGQLRLVLGFVLLGHAVNVMLLAAGGLQRRAAPLAEMGPEAADPLPQAFVLTAIVITFGITVHLLGLLRRGAADPDSGNDPDHDPDPAQGGRPGGRGAGPAEGDRPGDPGAGESDGGGPEARR
ncbi:hypothetical protein Vqi01_04900 [Micromonospora qiuiae]|uniref:Na+/H+ antiporter subunit C n=1 Tax=Micromonospora qiuiae TaxID=502268 RepID=A0ABQ4J583_9ACTN|nr:hypothetical protein Vqi01_04900 [Micromonospora qiuiae]